MIKNIVLICLTFFKFCVPAQNFSITYGFPELTTASGQVDPSITPTISGLHFDSFHSIGTSVQPNASARFSFTGWPLGANSGDNNYGNYSAVLSPTIYYEVRLFVDAGYTLNLNGLNFDVRRSGTGVRTYCVRSSLDNFTNNLAASTGTSSNLEIIPTDIFFWKYDSISTNNDQHGSSINFNSSFSAIHDTLTFRFYAWNSESSGGSFSLDNVNFSGVLTNSTNLTGIENNVTIEYPNKNIEVFPNPCRNDILTITSSVNFSKLELVNSELKILLSKQFETKTNKFILATELVPSGIYFLKVYSEKQIYIRQLIIE